MNSKNPYKAGDKVRLRVSIKDAYGEVWHEKGETVTVESIASDGIGLMFWSDLGTHYKNVDGIDSNQAIEKETLK